MAKYRIVDQVWNGKRLYIVEVKRWWGWRVCMYGNDHSAEFELLKEAEVFLSKRRQCDNPEVYRTVLYEVED